MTVIDPLRLLLVVLVALLRLLDLLREKVLGHRGNHVRSVFVLGVDPTDGLVQVLRVIHAAFGQLLDLNGLYMSGRGHYFMDSPLGNTQGVL